MRALNVKQLKPIKLKNSDFIFPMDSRTLFILDKKSSSKNKSHQLLYQQGRYYGQVDDRCQYLNNEDLLYLEENGMIEIKKTK